MIAYNCVNSLPALARILVIARNIFQLIYIQFKIVSNSIHKTVWVLLSKIMLSSPSNWMEIECEIDIVNIEREEISKVHSNKRWSVD